LGCLEHRRGARCLLYGDTNPACGCILTATNKWIQQYQVVNGKLQWRTDEDIPPKRLLIQFGLTASPHHLVTPITPSPCHLATRLNLAIITPLNPTRHE